MTAATDTDALQQQIEALQRKLYVPGFWCCAKCGFVLVQSNLNAHDGTVTARDTPGDKCPNDGSPLWRMSWEQNCREMEKRCEEQVDRAIAAEHELTEIKASMPYRHSLIGRMEARAHAAETALADAGAAARERAARMAEATYQDPRWNASYRAAGRVIAAAIRSDLGGGDAG